MNEGGTCGIGKQIGLLQHFARPLGHYLFPVSLPAAAAVRSRSSGRSEGVVRHGRTVGTWQSGAQLIRNSGGALVNLNKEPLDL